MEDNGKTAAIISYLTPIGWLIAYFGFYQNNKTALASYHLRQTLLFYIVWAILRFGLSILLSAIWLATGFFSLFTLLWVIQIIFFVLWIIGLIAAVNGEQKEIPVLGDKAQRIFSGL